MIMTFECDIVENTMGPGGNVLRVCGKYEVF